MGKAGLSQIVKKEKMHVQKKNALKQVIVQNPNPVPKKALLLVAKIRNPAPIKKKTVPKRRKSSLSTDSLSYLFFIYEKAYLPFLSLFH